MAAKQSLEDRLDALERKLPIYLAKIQAVDALTQSVGELKANLHEVFGRCDSLLEDVRSIQEFGVRELRQQMRSFPERLDKCTAECTAMTHNLIEEVASRIETFETSVITTIKQHFNAFNDLEEKLRAKVNEKDVEHLFNLEEKLDAHAQHIQNRMLFFAQKCDEQFSTAEQETAEEINKLNLKLDDLSREASTVMEVREAHAKQMAEIESTVHNFKLQMQKQLKDAAATIYEEMVKLPPAPVPKERSDQLKGIELNAENAFLRSTRNEKAIQLLDKKIDNLSLLIKKAGE